MQALQRVIVATSFAGISKSRNIVFPTAGVLKPRNVSEPSPVFWPRTLHVEAAIVWLQFLQSRCADMGQSFIA
jgi:hypothetical protein